MNIRDFFSTHRILLASAVCLAVVLGGCRRGTEDTDAAAESVQPSRGAVEETDALVVYTYDAFPGEMGRAIAAHFDESYGVSVDIRRFGDTGGLFNQVYLERSNPRGDVVIGLDNTYIGRALQEELFEPYEPAELDLVSDRLLVDPDYRLIPFDYGGITFNYDSETLADPPASWDDLLDPRFRDSIVLMNPATSSPGRNFLLFTIAEFGEEGYLEFWDRLKPNILTVTGGWTEGYGLYAQGEAPIVLSYETSPAYHIHYEEETRYRNIIFDGKAYIQVEVAGIVNGAANLVNARRFIDYMVSEAFQELIPLNQIMYPVHPGVRLPPAFEAIERADTLISLDEREVTGRIDEWLRAWESVMR